MYMYTLVLYVFMYSCTRTEYTMLWCCSRPSSVVLIQVFSSTLRDVIRGHLSAAVAQECVRKRLKCRVRATTREAARRDQQLHSLLPPVVARASGSHWIHLDRSFSGHQRPGFVHGNVQRWADTEVADTQRKVWFQELLRLRTKWVSNYMYIQCYMCIRENKKNCFVIFRISLQRCNRKPAPRPQQ